MCLPPVLLSRLTKLGMCLKFPKEYTKRLLIARQYRPDIYNDEEYDCEQHKVLVRQMNMRVEHGRSCRDIFIISQRIGRLLSEHGCNGPDIPSREYALHRDEDGEGRTMREFYTDRLRYAEPTVQTLLRVFDDPTKEERLGVISEVKSRLVSHMRNNAVVGRVWPRDAKRIDLATRAGKILISAAMISSKSFDDNAYTPSSNMVCPIGLMVHYFEMMNHNHISGSPTSNEISAQLSMQMEKTSTGYKKKFLVHWEECKGNTPTAHIAPVLVQTRPVAGGYQKSVSICHSKKKARKSLTKDEWPMSPVDCLSFFIHKVWPDEWDHRSFDEGNAVKTWWLSLGEPIRRFIISIYQETADQFSDIDRLPENCNGADVPTKALKLIIELRFPWVRGKIAEKIWNNLDPNFRDSIFEVYKQQSNSFCDSIRQEYQTVLGGLNPDLSAKVLLDIFLEVPQDSNYTSLPKVTSEYCNNLLDRMRGAMDRWNELIGLLQTDDNVHWNTDVLKEVLSLERKFGNDMIYKRRRNREQEFNPDCLVKQFLYQHLSSEHSIPDRWSLKKKVEEMKKLIESMANEDGASLETDTTVDMDQVLSEYRTYSSHNHSREHAMIAMIPLLPNLSDFDSKRLVYACFVEKECLDRRRSGGDGFSGDHFRDFSDHGHTNDNISDITNCFSLSNAVWEGWGSHKVLPRLFGLPLPVNIVSAMCSFLVERLYQRSLRDVNTLCNNAFEVLPFLERFTINQPEKASIVWDCLETALQNAIRVVDESNEANDNDWGEIEELLFRSVTAKLMRSCIKTRAKQVIPMLHQLYDLPEVLQPRSPLQGTIEKINQPSRQYVDCMEYHIDLPRDEEGFV